MEFTGERFIPGLALGEIEIEHKQRYYSVVDLVKDKIVLDAACGVGYGSAMLADHAKFVYGIDISKDAIDFALGQYKRENIEYFVGSIASIPLPDNSVDVVVSFETIEHVNEETQIAFLTEIKRVLRPDGIMIMSTPDKKSYSDTRNFRNVFHEKEFYLSEFKYFLEKHFQHVQLFGQGFETLCVISPNDKTLRENIRYKLVEENTDISQDKKYIIAICSDNQPKQLEYGNIMLHKTSPRYTSKLYIDLGDGYSDEVVEYSDLFVSGNEFFVEFKNLRNLKGIKGLRWQPLSNRFFRIKISSTYPSLTVTPLNAANQTNEFIEFMELRPLFEIGCNLNSIDEIKLKGDIHFLYDDEIYQLYKLQKTEIIEKLSQLASELAENRAHNQKILSDQVKLLKEKEVYKNQLKAIENEKEELVQKIELMQYDFEREITSLRRLVNQTIGERDHLFHERNHILFENSRLNDTINQLINSTSWKVTAPFRVMGLRLRESKRKTRRLIKAIVKGVYKKIPLDQRQKVKLKNIVYKSLRPLIKNTGMYQVWLQSQIIQQNNYISTLIPSNSFLDSIEELNESPGKIAIHLHLYYLDLADEFFRYLDKMPYPFDLFISIQKSDAKDEVEQLFKNLKFAEKVNVKVTPNRGRDVAPMVVDFADEIKKYDFFCHVHSKKSLYTGREQDGWRKHLLDNLFGDEKVLRKIFAMFRKNENLGLVYPESYNTIPYWAHTWLSNKEVGTNLLNRLGINHDFSKYIDFPAGTMFWARTEALMPLLDLGLTYEDFPEEAKQIDGTIAHAVERAIVPIVLSTNKSYAEINVYSGSVRYNKGNRNLMQYWPRKLNELKDIIDGFDVISFDIFDTLITRPLISPDISFKLVELEVKRLVDSNLNFVTMRKESEYEARKKKGFVGDVSIDEIYQQMSVLYRLESSVCELIKNIEIETELRLVQPRREVIDVLNYAKFMRKKIVLISDMYLEEATIKRMLKKCGINYYDQLLLSSKEQKRKDNGSMWDYFIAQYSGQRTLHIGDNEHSDVQIPEGKGLVVYHVMNGTNMYWNTDFGHFVLRGVNEKENWGDSVLIGSVISKEFNSPFKLSYSNGQYQIDSYHTLGYTIFGPIILKFITWLINKLQDDNSDKVLFLSREGYFLKKMFDLCVNRLGAETKLKELDTIYFLTSRRAASVASFSEANDLLDLLKTPFEGTIKDLFAVRYGIDIQDGSYNEMITLPEDELKVKQVVEKYTDQILENAKRERDLYLQYCKGLGLTGANISIVDVGYSGSIQLYLSKLLNQSIKGYYFVTSNKSKATRFPGNTMSGCFGENEDYLTTGSAVYKYQLVLESILTSEDGQLVNFIRNNKGELIPNFGPKGFAQDHFEVLNEVMKGVENYIEDVLQHIGKAILEMPTSTHAVERLLEATVLIGDSVDQRIKQSFLVEDNYCMSSEISVYDHYKKWFNL